MPLEFCQGLRECPVLHQVAYIRLANAHGSPLAFHQRTCLSSDYRQRANPAVKRARANESIPSREVIRRVRSRRQPSTLSPATAGYPCGWPHQDRGGPNEGLEFSRGYLCLRDSSLTESAHANHSERTAPGFLREDHLSLISNSSTSSIPCDASSGCKAGYRSLIYPSGDAIAL